MPIGLKLIMALAIALVVVIVALVIAAQMARQRREHEQLREAFGPEYNRTVAEYHNQGRAEGALQARQEHVKSLTIRPLTSDEQRQFAQTWRALQARFVDEPTRTIAEADQLIADLMNTRGYPVQDFEQRAADLSVNYPSIVQNYRAAHATAQACARGEASTEAARTAIIHYRSLFNELLEPVPTERTPSQGIEVR